MFNMKKHFPIYVCLAIIGVAILLYIDRKTNHFSPYVDLTLNVHWDEQNHKMEPVDIVKVSEENNVKNYHLGFISDAGHCNPAWGGQPGFSIYQEWAKPVIDNMLENDMKLVIAFGGTTGVDISALCSETELLNAYEKVIASYHPHGLEFNIENSTSNIQKIVAAIDKLQKKYPDLEIVFTLHTLPEGITPASEKILYEATENSIRYTVNLLVMNYGPSYTGNMAQYAILATRHLFDYLKKLYPHNTKESLWNMIELTPMIGVNNVANEEFTLADADTLTNFAKHFGIGEVSMWIANRDFPCPDKIANNYCSGNNLQTEPYEYESHFTR
jgi:chitinase